MIVINVANQHMHCKTVVNGIVEGSQEFVKFKFNFADTDWEGLTIFAQFIQNGIGYNQYLDEENCVFLPTEIKRGVCTLALYGTGQRTIGTSNSITFQILPNAIIHDANSTELTESLYQQIMSRIDSIVVGSGVQGEKGDKGDKGDKGEPFRYEDFTPEQLLSLETLASLVNALHNTDGEMHSISLGAANIAKLTDEQLEIIASKNINLQ